MGVTAGVETARQKAAYDYYYNLGAERSLNKVANHFGVSNATVKSWCDKYEWYLRVEEKNMEEADQTINKNNNSLIVEMEANRKVIRAGLDDFIKRLKNGEVKVTKVREAVDLMRLEKDYVEFILDIKDRTVKADAIEVSQMTRDTISLLREQIKNSLNDNEPNSEIVEDAEDIDENIPEDDVVGSDNLDNSSPLVEDDADNTTNDAVTDLEGLYNKLGGAPVLNKQ